MKSVLPAPIERGRGAEIARVIAGNSKIFLIRVERRDVVAGRAERFRALDAEGATEKVQRRFLVPGAVKSELLLQVNVFAAALLIEISALQ